MPYFVWFLDVNWVYMSLIAAAVAAVIHLVASIVAVVRIGRFKAIILVIISPIYSFISCFFYTIILAISVGFTYFYLDSSSEDVYQYWGLGFGIVYVILKIVITGYLK